LAASVYVSHSPSDMSRTRSQLFGSDSSDNRSGEVKRESPSEIGHSDFQAAGVGVGAMSSK
jgi:hypothetical protein